MSEKKESGLVGIIAEQMTKLKTLVDKNEALTPQDKKNYEKIYSEYEGFVGSLELKPGQDAPQAKEVPNLIGVPLHAGSSDCEPCL